MSVPGTDGSAFGDGTAVSVTVQGSGELALTSRGRIFTLGAGQTLILGETGGSGPTLRGLGGNNGSDTSTVRLDNDGTFTMNSGTITGNTNKMGGESGGVHVNGGAFTMNGGTISDNSCKNWGGGVYVRDGTFTMKDGTISSNRCDMAGGGVYVYDGEFTKSGESSGSISSNSSKSNGTQVYYNVTPPEYRNNNLGEDDDISTDDLETNWEN